MLYLQVIRSMIPNDDFGGFEPLRLQVRMTSIRIKRGIVVSQPLTICLSPQKPGFYEPKVAGDQ